ncbi:MAG: type II toxin-antitoxin system HipA family toxin [Gammaproteobacteria bacterium]|nr:type II toxin-antitoxin system HipA family toxin [Gammaproteobacteria bacterium]
MTTPVNTLAEVKLWGRRIGAVALAAESDVASFEYEAAFAGSGIEVSPLVMPLSRQIYQFADLPRGTFYGLPGLLADSLPDRFGNQLINAWLARQGRTPDSFNAVERLCYIGARGMGALEFLPTTGPKAIQSSELQINHLVELASEVLSERADMHSSFADDHRAQALTDILRVGTSAGGARAKAVIAWNPATNEVRSGQLESGDGFQYWLLKFDGVTGNKDKELEDPQGYGAIEYAYSNMARDCGIEISECRLFEEGNRRHFMTRRFDRSANGAKLHMQTLGALAHYDLNAAGAYGYEQALLVIRQLGLPMSATEEQFRRMVFNVVARNQDDHVKNIAFLMNKQGQWSLSPAFDITYSYNPQGQWTGSHQMTLNGKRDDFVLADFVAVANSASMAKGRARTIIEEVQDVVSHWRDYAHVAGVSDDWQRKIQKVLRLGQF